jgi:hypothetical protein
MVTKNQVVVIVVLQEVLVGIGVVVAQRIGVAQLNGLEMHLQKNNRKCVSSLCSG